MKKLIWIVGFFCLACSTGSNKRIAEEKLNFSYIDDAYLFFRNMRQATYNLQDLKEEGVRLYQHEDFEEDQFFQVQMAVNWRMNRAFMLIKLPDSVEKEQIRVFVERDSVFELEQENWRRQGELKFLTSIYNHILEKDSFSLVYGEERMPLFMNNDQREAFRISMYDFYRLTALL